MESKRAAQVNSRAFNGWLRSDQALDGTDGHENLLCRYREKYSIWEFARRTWYAAWKTVSLCMAHSSIKWTGDRAAVTRFPAQEMERLVIAQIHQRLGSEEKYTIGMKH